MRSSSGRMRRAEAVDMEASPVAHRFPVLRPQLDAARLALVRDDVGDETLARLLTMTPRAAASHFAVIVSAVEGAELAGVRRGAHTLSGTLSMVGAIPAEELARRLEVASSLEEARPLVAMLGSVLEATYAALAEERQALGEGPLEGSAERIAERS